MKNKNTETNSSNNTTTTKAKPYELNEASIIGFTKNKSNFSYNLAKVGKLNSIKLYETSSIVKNKNGYIITSSYYDPNAIIEETDNSIIKFYDQNGNEIWSKIYSGNNKKDSTMTPYKFEKAYFVDDGIIVICDANLTYQIIKYNFSGNILWVKEYKKTYGSNEKFAKIYQFYKVIELKENYYLIGEKCIVTENNSSPIKSYYYDYHGIVIKLDKNGNELKEYEYNNNNLTYFTSAQVIDDKIYLSLKNVNTKDNNLKTYGIVTFDELNGFSNTSLTNSIISENIEDFVFINDKYYIIADRDLFLIKDNKIAAQWEGDFIKILKNEEKIYALEKNSNGATAIIEFDNNNYDIILQFYDAKDFSVDTDVILIYNSEKMQIYKVTKS